MIGVTGLVLCGGRARRLGGIDKPLARYAGGVLLERILGRLTPQVDRVLISANRNLDRYRSYAPVVTDHAAYPAGPLAGIQAARDLLESEYLFVCPGDAPNLPPDVVARLLGAFSRSPGARAAVAHDGRRRQPLHLLLRAGALATLDDYLATASRSAHGWLERLETLEVDFSDRPDAFVNLNTPRDFRRARF